MLISVLPKSPPQSILKRQQLIDMALKKSVITYITYLLPWPFFNKFTIEEILEWSNLKTLSEMAVLKGCLLIEEWLDLSFY